MCVLVYMYVLVCVCVYVCAFYTLLYNDFCCCPSNGRAQLASDAGVCCTFSLRRFVITAIRVEPQSIPLSLPLSPSGPVAHVIRAYQHADPSISSAAFIIWLHLQANVLIDGFPT